MLSDQSFLAVTDLFHQVSGIRLSAAKRALVSGRLQKLAQERGSADLEQYVHELMRSGDEGEIARVVDKLTTNETYFFREPAHFEHLADWLAQRQAAAGAAAGAMLRVWSGASSSGEEAYSIAMLLAEHLRLERFEIVGTDLSGAMVEAAHTGLYPLERAKHMPPEYLKRWCMKGQGEYEGQLLIRRELRERVHFVQANLTQPLPPIGRFDVIFLRNVLIYFDNPGKADIVQRVLTHLSPQGLLYTGHAESIANLGLPVRALASAIYTHAAQGNGADLHAAA